MAVEVLVRPVEQGDIEYIAANMRAADLDEIAAVGHPDPVEALTQSLRASTVSWTGCADGEPGCIFGVVPISMISGIGSPWLLGTEIIPQNAGAFIRHSRPYIHTMLREYPQLFNFVDVRNRKAIAWLKRSGFKLHPAAPYGPFNLPFHLFEMRA